VAGQSRRAAQLYVGLLQAKMKITQGNVPVALDIMREAASWLTETGPPLWRMEDITEHRILDGITSDDVYVGWVADESAAAMILQWNDTLFWPSAKDDSGFIHKLAVRRRFAGANVSRQLIEWAKRKSAARKRIPQARLRGRSTEALLVL